MRKRTWKSIPEIKRMKPGNILYKGSESFYYAVVFVGIMDHEKEWDEGQYVAYRECNNPLIKVAHHSHFLRHKPLSRR